MRAAEAAFVLGVLIIVAVLLVLAVKAGARVLVRWWSSKAAGKWKPNYHIRNGIAVVVVERGNSSKFEQRIVKELPPAPNPLEFQSDLELALQDADLEAKTLNKFKE